MMRLPPVYSCVGIPLGWERTPLLDAIPKWKQNQLWECLSTSGHPDPQTALTAGRHWDSVGEIMFDGL